MSPLIPLAVSAAAPLLYRALAGGPPKPPDLVSPIVQSAGRDRARLEAMGDRRSDRVRRDAAARGLSSGAMAGELDRVQRGNNEALVDLSARASEAIAGARNQNLMNQYNSDFNQYTSRAQGVSDIANAVGQYYMMREMFGNDGDVDADIAPDLGGGSLSSRVGVTGAGTDPMGLVEGSRPGMFGHDYISSLMFGRSLPATH